MVIAFDAAGLTLTVEPVVRSTAVMPTAKLRLPLPVTPVHVKVKVCCAPAAMLADAGLGGPQLADAVPLGASSMFGITESAGLPLLSTVAVTVMESPGRTLEPPGPAAASPVIASATLLIWMARSCFTAG